MPIRKPKTPHRDHLIELQRTILERMEARKAFSQTMAQTKAKVSDLAGQRQSVIYKDRSLVDHTLMPLDPENPVGLIDKELGKLRDPDDMQKEYEHLHVLQEQAERNYRLYVEEHYELLINEIQTEGVEKSDEVQKALEQLVRTIGPYKVLRDECLDWARQVPGLDPDRVIPGGHIIDMAEQINGVSVPAPVHEVRTHQATMIHDPRDPDLDHKGDKDV
jgi:hypothetical protein